MMRITVAKGDGIGPEITDAVLNIFKAAKVSLEYDFVEVGAQAYKNGHTNGISPEDWETVLRNKVFLKAPTGTPSGGGHKSFNVTARKGMGLFANVRPCVSYNPVVATKHPGMNVVIIRENEEDLYTGIEHRLTPDSYQGLKQVSESGCERVIRYAFEYAKLHGRKKVTCFAKPNIMKITDGTFVRVFNQISNKYPDIGSETYIVDIGSARLATRPRDFDVVVTMNLYGDIISDIAAEITGSVGLGASSNIGDEYAMFEAIHVTAPDIAGQDKANPSGLLLAAVQMLVHLGMHDKANLIHNAWLNTIEHGIHTGDIKSKLTIMSVGTNDFAKQVISRLGDLPTNLMPIEYKLRSGIKIQTHPISQPVKQLVGVDIYFDVPVQDSARFEVIEFLASKTKIDPIHLIKLDSISNRGMVVWKDGKPVVGYSHLSDLFGCRFIIQSHTDPKKQFTARSLMNFILYLIDSEMCDRMVKTDFLFNFDGQPGYSLLQGE